jgi:hypothetical protein
MGVYRVKWWFEDHWRYLGTAVAGLAVGAAAGVGVATGVPWESTESVVNPPSTSTVLRIRTEAAKDADTNVGTGTQTAAAAQGATATVPASPGSVSYSGNGGKNLGTITVSSSSTLRWTNDGAIQISDDSGGIAINSEAHSGSTAVEPGTYKNVHVNAIGKWTITIKAE